MKKTWYILPVFICLVCALVLSSCSGYNRNMRRHLENADNYHAYRAEIVSVYYYDSKNRQEITDYSDPDFLAHDVTLEVVFSDYETLRAFLGGSPNTDIALDEYVVHLKITKENNQILLDNGFYDVVESHTPIDIMASSYIYMDGNFFFVASLTYGDVEYLAFDDGLSNIIQMMNADKSLF